MDAAPKGEGEGDGERAVSQKSPDAFRTISEVSVDLDVPQHVLRFWEGKFAQIRPLKRGGGRRYYRPEDVDLLRGIQHLLYGDGYTIKGVQKLLRENGVKHVTAAGRRDPAIAKIKPAAAPAVAAAASNLSSPVLHGGGGGEADGGGVAPQSDPEPIHDEEADSRRIETAARLLARLKALRRDFDTRLQAAKNGRSS